ncbi:MAG: hypothetical protein ACK4IX_11830 [Candidatus Sericytochromatia bacterium]
MTTYYVSCQVSFSQEILESDIKKSIDYQSKKAEIKYTNIGQDINREIFIKGLRVSDIELVRLSGKNDLLNQLNEKIITNRISNLSNITVSVPIGIGFLYTSSLNRELINTNSIRTNNTDFKSFALSTIGSIFILYSLINSVYFISEISGLSNTKLLSNKDSEDLVDIYNDQLIKDIINKNKNSYDQNLYYSNNNIMILNVEKFF